MSEWMKGDRVQREDNDDRILVGVVTDVEYDQREERDDNYGYRYSASQTKTVTYTKSVKVKWDGSEEEKSYKPYAVHAEDSEMERAYRLAVDDAKTRMNQKLAIARAALDEAVAISEETGVPLSADVSPLSQSYIPQSMQEKFPDVDREFMTELAGGYGEYDGWQHSAVCWLNSLARPVTWWTINKGAGRAVDTAETVLTMRSRRYRVTIEKVTREIHEVVFDGDELMEVFDEARHLVSQRNKSDFFGQYYVSKIQEEPESEWKSNVSSWQLYCRWRFAASGAAH